MVVVTSASIADFIRAIFIVSSLFTATLWHLPVKR
jgi:hypothetical protein